MLDFEIPPKLRWLERSQEGREWLAGLPACVRTCAAQWSLQLDPPYRDSNVSIVFPAILTDRSPAVLKLQFPHPESEYEAVALRVWNGQGAVRLFDWEPTLHALLMEKCEPGSPLSAISTEEALAVLIDLLPKLWVPASHPFRTLQQESTSWAEQLSAFWERAGHPFEVELFDTAIEALRTLGKSQGEQVLIHQDLHGDNVLRATREPWLVIDPKPLVGEREFSIAPIVRAREFGHSQDLVVKRLNKLTCALKLNRERARLWSLAQTLAWGFEGDRVIQTHLDIARWLWHA